MLQPPAAGPTRGAVSNTRPSELGRLCFKTTSRDLAGEAIPEDGRVFNMRSLREFRQDAAAAAGTRRSYACTPGSGGSTPSSPARRFGLYTLYSGDFNEKPSGQHTVNHELSESFKGVPRSKPRDIPCEGSSYGAMSKKHTPSRVAAAKPMPFPEEDNALAGLIGSGSDPVTSSHSRRHHAAPAKELVATSEPMPYAGCPYWLGAGSSGSTFQESQYRLEFARASSQRPPRRATASAPDLALVAGGGDPEGIFRSATMRSQYKSHFSTAHRAPGDCPVPPRAADIRRTILGR